MKPQASPAYQRNREPLARALTEILPATGVVLELASGPGAHAGFFAQRFPELRWQPTDVAEDALASCRAWVEELDCANLLAPLALDARSDRWPVSRCNAVVAINLIHISPFPTVVCGLFAGAARTLGGGEPVVLYGPFFRNDQPTAASNLAFDQSLRLRNPEWGVRQLEDVVAIGSERGFELDRVVDMPANNVVVVMRKSG